MLNSEPGDLWLVLWKDDRVSIANDTALKKHIIDASGCRPQDSDVIGCDRIPPSKSLMLTFKHKLPTLLKK